VTAEGVYSEENPVVPITLGLVSPMDENPVFDWYDARFLSIEALRGYRVAPGA